MEARIAAAEETSAERMAELEANLAASSASLASDPTAVATGSSATESDPSKLPESSPQQNRLQGVGGVPAMDAQQSMTASEVTVVALRQELAERLDGLESELRQLSEEHTKHTQSQSQSQGDGGAVAPANAAVVESSALLQRMVRNPLVLRSTASSVQCRPYASVLLARVHSAHRRRQRDLCA
jgi:hypothetical protein